MGLPKKCPEITREWLLYVKVLLPNSFVLFELFYTVVKR